MIQLRPGRVIIGLALILYACAAPQEGPNGSDVAAMWEQHKRAGESAYQRGQIEEASRLFELALEEAEVFGERDPRLATSLDNLALLCKAQGRFIKAEQLYQRSLTIREKVLGPQHPHVAESLSNLVWVYRAQGRMKEATRLLRDHRHIWEHSEIPMY